VFAVTLGGSWLLTVLLRKIPLVARTIWSARRLRHGGPCSIAWRTRVL